MFVQQGALLAILLVLIAFPLSAQVPWDNLPLADSLYRVKAYEPALEQYQPLLQFYFEKKTFLKAARCAAQTGDKKLAVKYLGKAFDLGWTTRSLTSDHELAPLRQDARFVKLAAKMEESEKRRSAFSSPELLAELDAMYADDQKFRNRKERQAEQVQLDSLNLIRLEKIIERHGWPGSNQLNGRNYGWLIVQRQPLPVQKKYLKIMAKAVKKGDEEAAFMAYLEDRILVAEGKEQKYGTQIDKENRRLYPVKDLEKVDLLRARVGLGPIETLRKLNNLQ